MEVYVRGKQMTRQILKMVARATSQLAAVWLFAGVAQAETRCSVPMTNWQPRDAVVRLAAENGWKVRRIKIDDGCYEVVGTDSKGRKFEVKVHPGTLAVIKHEFDDDDHDRKDKD